MHVILQELTRGPTFGSAKHPRKRFRQSRARAVAMSVVLQLEERVLEKHWWLLKPRSSRHFFAKGGPKNGSARRPQEALLLRLPSIDGFERRFSSVCRCHCDLQSRRLCCCACPRLTPSGAGSLLCVPAIVICTL